MNIHLRVLTAMLAAVFGAGLFLVATTSGATAGSAADDRAVTAKRQDGISELVTVDDDDDGRGDPTNTDTKTNSGTGNSNSGRDGTNSRVTNVSRDRDLSRRDLTKDRTRDGGDRTRDHSRNYTNDGSRHDTRG